MNATETRQQKEKEARQKDKKFARIRIRRVRDIIALFESGMTVRMVAEMTGKSLATITKYRRELRKAGFTVPPKKSQKGVRRLII